MGNFVAGAQNPLGTNKDLVGSHHQIGQGHLSMCLQIFFEKNCKKLTKLSPPLLCNIQTWPPRISSISWNTTNHSFFPSCKTTVIPRGLSTHHNFKEHTAGFKTLANRCPRNALTQKWGKLLQYNYQLSLSTTGKTYTLSITNTDEKTERRESANILLKHERKSRRERKREREKETLQTGMVCCTC